MAANEMVTVLRIDTGDSEVTVKQLKDRLRDLQKQLETTALANKKDYTEAAKAVKEQTLILNDVMYAQKKEISGVEKSYNTLSAEMGRLKKIQKDIDISTAAGVEEYHKMAEEINAINDELKDLDKQNGVFVRNVGNYQSALEHLGDYLKDAPAVLSGVKDGIAKVDATSKLLASNPIMGIVQLLSPLITKIAEGVKDNEKATAALKKILDSLKPVFNVIENTLEKIVGWVADMIGKLGDLAGESTGTFSKIVAGAVGVGNAILQFLLMPIRNVIDAAKGLGNVFSNVFKGQFKEAANAAKEAVKEIGENIKNGFSFKANFEEGQRVGEEFAAGLKSPKVKKEAKEAAKTVAKDATKEAIDSIMKELDELDKKLDERRKMMKDEAAKIAKEVADETAALTAEIDAMFDAEFQAQQQAVKDAEEAAAKKLEIQQAYIASAQGLMNTLADILEGQGDEDEKSVKAAKALRIASATIDMIQGAVTAYSTAQSLGPIAGPIVGAANAAAVVAAGAANIAKIKATQVSKSGSASAPQVETPAPATVSAPSYTYTPQEQMRTVTSASEEDRLNRMASDQRVYILESDIQASGQASRVRVDESTF